MYSDDEFLKCQVVSGCCFGHFERACDRMSFNLVRGPGLGLKVVSSVHLQRSQVRGRVPD